jgi:ferritin
VTLPKGRIYTYIIDRGARPQFGAHEAPTHEWASPLAAMQDAYNHECFISEKINACVTLALKESDHPTNTMLQWFVNEQVEEEASADDIVQKLKLIGDNTSALFLMDNELASRSFTADSGGE